jgi:hypothetical protein
MTNEPEDNGEMLDTDTPVRRRGPYKPRNPQRDAPRSGPRVHRSANGEILTRSRRGGLDPFVVPLGFEPEGFKYQWCVMASLGNKDIAQDFYNEFYQNGWRPVPAKRHDGHWMPKGYDGAIVVRGQALMERPEEMCIEAANEDKRNAIQQMRDRDESLMGGKAQLNKAMRDGFEMGGKYRGTGGNLKMSIDPALDIPMPSHKLAEPGE